jgi:Flp pilus assembly protein TadG
MQCARLNAQPRRRVAQAGGFLAGERLAATTLEFAIAASALMLLVLASFEVGYDFFVAEALDYAVHVASRSVQVGTSQGSAKGSAASFWVTQQVCPALGALLSCNNLYVSITAIPNGAGQNYYTYIAANPPSLASMMSSTNPVCTGSGGQMLLLSAYYLSPTFLGLLLPAWSQPSPSNNSMRVHLSYASAGFVDEYFPGGETGC